MDLSSKIYIAGHRGLVGSAIMRNLQKQGYTNIITKTRQELDLLDADRVAEFFQTEKPGYVFLAAAKVGGIMANNTYPAEFIRQNLVVQNNVIHNAYLSKTKKLLFLGSSCIYPKMASQPIKEEYLLSGPLEETNKAYAVAKIAGIIMCQAYNTQYGTNFISVMPTNLYGPGDNFDPENSHVLPALIRKFYEAQRDGKKEITLWGTGGAQREFLHVDDLADACVFLMENIDAKDTCDLNSKEIKNTHINIGSGEDISIKELAYLIKNIIGFDGGFYFNTSKPDGTMLKLTDPSKLHNLGWKHKIEFEDGIKMTVIDDVNHFTEWDTKTNFYIKCQDKYGNQPLPNECIMIIRPFDI